MLIKNIDNQLERKLKVLEANIGNTPLVRIQGFPELTDKVKLYAKLEWQQMGMSVKTRPAYYIIKDAIEQGYIDADRHLLDASSGNTGVAYGSIAAALGIPVTLCLPANASEPKKAALRLFGVNIVETSPFESTDGAQEKARELADEHPDKYYYADQYNNDNNWKAHYNSTAPEIWQQTRGKVTHFVAGLGTTGTFTGTTRGLKELDDGIEAISLQPAFALHALEGWKHLETARVPGIYDNNLADRNLTVETEKALKLIKPFAAVNGYALSPSSAANLAGALQVAAGLEKGTIVTVFPDHASNYPEVLKTLFEK